MGGEWRMVVMMVVVVVMVEIAVAPVRFCPGNSHCVNFSQCGNLQGPIQTCSEGRGSYFKVCCPRSIGIDCPVLGPILPGLPQHALSRYSRSVVGGQDVELSQPYPWMAVLGYNSKTNPIWACGGSLISAQYVLTAAHCVHADHTGGLTLSVVRMGEIDLSTARDCEPGRFGEVCAPTPQDFSPAKIIIHPNFNTRTSVSDDIALIRLDKKASYNRFVRPICLPAPGVGVKAALGQARNGELAGWGLNETLGNSISVLQRAVIPFMEKTQCTRHFPKLVPEQVCFGGAKQDSCQGDSGGPVFVRGQSGILLLGLVSHGLDFRCGTFGVPAVYTDVTAYRSWIVGKLEP